MARTKTYKDGINPHRKESNNPPTRAQKIMLPTFGASSTPSPKTTPGPLPLADRSVKMSAKSAMNGEVTSSTKPFFTLFPPELRELIYLASLEVAASPGSKKINSAKGIFEANRLTQASKRVRAEFLATVQREKFGVHALNIHTYNQIMKATLAGHTIRSLGWHATLIQYEGAEELSSWLQGLNWGKNAHPVDKEAVISQFQVSQPGNLLVMEMHEIGPETGAERYRFEGQGWAFEITFWDFHEGATGVAFEGDLGRLGHLDRESEIW